MSDMNDQLERCGWVKVFHPSGLLTTLPVPCGEGVGYDYAAAFACVNAILAAGFTANAPGLGAGENREQVGYVCRREKENKDGTLTAILDLYPANESAKFKFLSLYLNGDEDVISFEEATGMRLRHIPLCENQVAPKRGENRRIDEKIVKVPNQAFAVWIDNPKYDSQKAEAAVQAKEVYTVPKKKFVRWEGKAAQPQPQAESQTEPDLAGWQEFLSGDPPRDDLNRKLPDMARLAPAAKERVRMMISDHASRAGWKWDAASVSYVENPNAKPYEVPF